MGLDNSYFNYDDLNLFQTPPDGAYGAKLGFNYIFNVTDFYSPRLSTTYTFQNVKQQYLENSNTIDIYFENHVGGLEIIPIAVQFGGLVKGGISLGLFYNYLFLNKYNIELKTGSLNYEDFEFNKPGNGVLVGLDFHVKKMFFELRWMAGKQQFIQTPGLENTINQFQILMNL